MNRDILTVWQNTESPGTALIGPGLLLLFVDYFLFFFHVKLILVGIKEFVFKKGETLIDRKSTRLNSSHWNKSRMPSSA